MSMERVTGDVPVACEYALSRRWSKKAKAVFRDGKLVPCEIDVEQPSRSAPGAADSRRVSQGGPAPFNRDPRLPIDPSTGEETMATNRNSTPVMTPPTEHDHTPMGANPVPAPRSSRPGLDAPGRPAPGPGGTGRDAAPRGPGRLAPGGRGRRGLRRRVFRTSRSGSTSWCAGSWPSWRTAAWTRAGAGPCSSGSPFRASSWSTWPMRSRPTSAGAAASGRRVAGRPAASCSAPDRAHDARARINMP